jgi:hypothetical protein
MMILATMMQCYWLCTFLVLALIPMKSSVAFAVGPGPSFRGGGSNAVSTRSSSMSTPTSHVGVASTSMASSAPVAIPISLSEVC